MGFILRPNALTGNGIASSEPTRWGRYTLERISAIAKRARRNRASVERTIVEQTAVSEKKEVSLGKVEKAVHFLSISVALGSIPTLLISLFVSRGEQLIRDVQMSTYMFFAGVIARYIFQSGDGNNLLSKAYKQTKVEAEAEKTLS